MINVNKEVWYNSVTRECQTTPPYGNSTIPQDMIDELLSTIYSMWSKKESTFIPPVPSPTQKELVANLEIEYSAKRANVIEKITIATANNKPSIIIALQAQYATLIAEQKTKKELIING